MRRGRRQPPPDLTSLFDVLFIVIFAALIRAAAVQQAAATPTKAPPPPARLDPASLQARAVGELGARPAIVLRVSASGMLTALEHDGRTMPLDAPLLEHSSDPDIALAYLGDRSAELRVCGLAALHLGAPDLAGYLVIIAPERRLVDLPHALFDGLHRDVDRCLADQKGLAVIVGPS